MKKRFFGILCICLVCALLCSACGVPLNLGGIDVGQIFDTTTTPTLPSEPSTDQTDGSGNEPSGEQTEGTTTTTSTTEPSDATSRENSADSLPDLTPPDNRADFTTVSYNGGVKITAYNGRDTVVDIPASFDGGDTVAVGDNVFENNTTVTHINFPASVTEIGTSAFSGCTALRTALLPSALETIGASAFAGCTALSIAYLPNSLTTVGASAFAGCSDLVLVLAGENNGFSADFADAATPIYTSVTDYSVSADGLHSGIVGGAHTLFRFVFTNTGIVNIPATITVIGTNAFCGATKLTQVTLPANITDLGAKAFYGCTNLARIYYNITDLQPDLTTYPGGNVFFATEVMKDIGTTAPNGVSVVVGDNVLALPSFLFRDCTAIRSLSIGKGLTTAIPESTFERVKLANLYWNAVSYVGLAEISSFSTLSFDETSDHLSVVIGKDCTAIPANFLRNVTALQTLTFEEGSTCVSIGKAAFRACGFTEITLPDTLRIIDEYAFYKVNLDHIIIPNGVKTIANNAFYQNTSSTLAYIVLPETLTDLQVLAFFSLPTDCAGFYYYGDQNDWETLIAGLTFTGANSSSPLNPDGSKKAEVYYYSETNLSGAWHMVDGVPTLWE